MMRRTWPSLRSLSVPSSSRVSSGVQASLFPSVTVSRSSRSLSSSVRGVVFFQCDADSHSTFAEDELVSLDELQEKVAEFDDYVQSSDVAAMQSKSHHSMRLGGDTDVYLAEL